MSWENASLIGIPNLTLKLINIKIIFNLKFTFQFFLDIDGGYHQCRKLPCRKRPPSYRELCVAECRVLYELLLLRFDYWQMRLNPRYLSKILILTLTNFLREAQPIARKKKLTFDF